MKRLSCVGCGAPLNGYSCEYCGSRYERTREHADTLASQQAMTPQQAWAALGLMSGTANVMPWQVLSTNGRNF